MNKVVTFHICINLPFDCVGNITYENTYWRWLTSENKVDLERHGRYHWTIEYQPRKWHVWEPPANGKCRGNTLKLHWQKWSWAICLKKQNKKHEQEFLVILNDLDFFPLDFTIVVCDNLVLSAKRQFFSHLKSHTTHSIVWSCTWRSLNFRKSYF